MYRTRSRLGTKNVTRTGECSVNIDKLYAVQDAACSRSEMPLFSKTRSKFACNRANRGKSRKKRSFRYIKLENLKVIFRGKTRRQTSWRYFSWSRDGVTMESLKNIRNAVTFEFLEQSLKKRKFHFESRVICRRFVRNIDTLSDFGFIGE